MKLVQLARFHQSQLLHQEGSCADFFSSTCNLQTSQKKYKKRKVQNGGIGGHSLGASVLNKQRAPCACKIKRFHDVENCCGALQP